jgi:hypothetical protein
MKTRPIIDTDAELDRRVTELTAILDGHDASSTFKRHHLKQALIQAQNDAGERAATNLRVSMERDWTESEPKPSGEEEWVKRKRDAAKIELGIAG